MSIFAGLKIPVISAPMAGGINNPEMVSAVINAGGIGSFGFAYSSSQKIEEDLRATIALCKDPNPSINANFFIFKSPEAPSETEIDTAIRDLKNLSGISVPAYPQLKEPYFPDLDEQLEPIWKIKPKFLTFHFGLPKREIFERAKSLGILVGVTATSVDEAIVIEQAGADFIVAQGIEAGGHRGIFEINAFDEQLSAMLLLQRLKASIKLPVVLAGGIMLPADVKAALVAGAAAVQMGSAFLTTKESTASPAHKRYLLTQHTRGVAYTKAFSGRWAQGINNRFMAEMKDKTTLTFPLQNTLTAGIRQEALKLDDGEYQSLWCGSRYALCQEISIEDLMGSIAKELVK